MFKMELKDRVEYLENQLAASHTVVSLILAYCANHGVLSLDGLESWTAAGLKNAFGEQGAYEVLVPLQDRIEESRKITRAFATD